MIDLTPLEVRQKKGDFRRALRGYDPELVNDFLDLVADRMEELVKENLALRDAAGSVHDELTAYRHKEQALSEALMAAQKLREDARDHAEREGDLLLREARLAAETLRQEAARQAVREEEALRQVRARRVQLVESFRRLLEREMSELDVIQETLDLRPSPTGAFGPELTAAPAAGAARAEARTVEAEPEAGTEAGTVPSAWEAEDEVVPDARSSDRAAAAADAAADEAAPDEEAADEEQVGSDAGAAAEQPLNLEWPDQEFTAREDSASEKRAKPEGFDAADASDEEQDDWLSSLMEED